MRNSATQQQIKILKRPVFPLVVSEKFFIVAEQDATLLGSDDDPDGHNGCFEARTEIQRCGLLFVAHIHEEANWRADQHSGFFGSLYRFNTPTDRGRPDDQTIRRPDGQTAKMKKEEWSKEMKTKSASYCMCPKRTRMLTTSYVFGSELMLQ